jgi:hypothetical protein
VALQAVIAVDKLSCGDSICLVGQRVEAGVVSGGNVRPACA